MALINGALQIGRSAISVSQAALSVAGNNIANVATPSYSRQVAHLVPTQYTEVLPGKYTGTGVSLYNIQRQVDEALNSRIRTAVGDSASNMVQQQAMSRVEAAFNELTEEDLSSRLNAFFGSWSSLQSQPQDMASRNVVLQTGSSLVNFVRELRLELVSVQEDLDSQVSYQVSQADSLAREIADLNMQIASSEAGQSGSSAALRDQRDEVLKQLSELINISTHEIESGAVNVYIGNEPLIQYSDSRGLSYSETQDANGNLVAQVVFVDNSEAVSLTAGKLHGLITARDDQIGGAIENLDAWTSALIYEVNNLHSAGRSLDNFSSVTSARGVDDADASLADTALTELPWQVSNGAFNIHLYDSNGDIITTQQIKVNIGIDGNDTTLTSLASEIDSISGITAYVDGANQLHIEATSSGDTFAFSSSSDSDSVTNVLSVLGINTFFDGDDAVDIAIKSDLLGEPRRIVAGANGLPGDGTVAGQIAQLASVGVSSLNGVSLSENFTSLVGQIATDTRRAQDNYKAADVVAQTLELERSGVSGVSIDEEAMKMMTYQRAFQGAARYVSLIDQLLDEVLSLV